MSVKIVTLSENSANVGVMAEWGLSLLIESEGRRILLDAGQSTSVTHNARIRGIDLSTVDKIVLSHGHFDHTGGLRDILLQAGEVEIIAHPAVFSAKHWVSGDIEQYIGIPFTQTELEALGAKFTLTSDPVWLTDKIVTTGEVPMRNDYEIIDPALYVKAEGAWQPDELPDDLSIGIVTTEGLVVVLGCAHRGMINTVWHLQQITGEQRVYGIIGGTHLITASADRLEWTIAELRTMDIQKLGVSHCTGFSASCRLAGEFPDTFFLNNSGNSFELP